MQFYYSSKGTKVAYDTQEELEELEAWDDRNIAWNEYLWQTKERIAELDKKIPNWVEMSPRRLRKAKARVGIR